MRKLTTALLTLALAGCGQGLEENQDSRGADEGNPDLVVVNPTNQTGSSDQQSEVAGGQNNGGASDDTRDPTGITDGEGSPAPLCLARPACDAPPPSAVKSGWRHPFLNGATVRLSPRHRGRDLFFREGDEQWVIGKFAYGPLDDDIKDEEIQLFLLRDCKGTWERIMPNPGKFPENRFLTHRDADDVSFPGVRDEPGGRIFVKLSDTSVGRLGVGRHRVRMVVSGDLSFADTYLEVLPQTARIAVSDVDGTLTSSETAAWTTSTPGANPGSAAVLQALSRRGFHILYLTARPEWFTARTRSWLELRGYPAGILRTVSDEVPLVNNIVTGNDATEYKVRELQVLKDSTGVTPSYGFGNTDTDHGTYKTAGIPASRSFFFKHDVPSGEGYTHTDYNTLLPTVEAEEPICQ